MPGYPGWSHAFFSPFPSHLTTQQESPSLCLGHLDRSIARQIKCSVFHLPLTSRPQSQCAHRWVTARLDPAAGLVRHRASKQSITHRLVMMLQPQLSFHSLVCWLKGKAVLTHLMCLSIFPPPAHPHALYVLLISLFCTSLPFFSRLPVLPSLHLSSFPCHTTFCLPLGPCMHFAFSENHLYPAVCSHLPQNTFLLCTLPKLTGANRQLVAVFTSCRL